MQTQTNAFGAISFLGQFPAADWQRRHTKCFPARFSLWKTLTSIIDEPAGDFLPFITVPISVSTESNILFAHCFDLVARGIFFWFISKTAGCYLINKVSNSWVTTSKHLVVLSSNQC